MKAGLSCLGESRRLAHPVNTPTVLVRLVSLAGVGSGQPALGWGKLVLGQGTWQGGGRQVPQLKRGQGGGCE